MSAISQRIRRRATPGPHPRLLVRLLRVREVARAVDLLESRTQARERLVERPVFVLSSVRSGSTLLRMLLNAHSQIRAPHELHLHAVRVNAFGMSGPAMAELGLSGQRLQFLLWDRVLHRELLDSGRRVLVDKTPSNSMSWRTLLRCWPQARFVFLRRHPGAIAASWHSAHPELSPAELGDFLLPYLTGMDDAYAGHGGLLTHYEGLVANPAAELGRICEFLELQYEPTMLDYSGSGPVARRGLGDWSPKIHSGRIQPVTDLPDAADMPEALRPFAQSWGYL